jgi:hypothetical protein
LALTLLAPACEDNGGSGDGGGDGSDGDGGSGADSRSGRAILNQLDSAGSLSHLLFASFFNGATLDQIRYGQLPGCTVAAEAGDCQVISCPEGQPDRFDAGTITATVEGGGSISASPGPNTGYSSPGPGEFFTAGQEVQFESTGAEVPAFTGSVTAPDPSGVTLPDTVPLSEDLSLTWSSTIAADTLEFVLSPRDGDPIRCVVPGSSGAVSMDASLLGTLSAGEAMLGVSAVNETEVTAGDWAVSLAAMQSMSQSDVQLQ